MTQIRTDLRNTRESAAKIRSQSFGTVTATNVQNALKEIANKPASVTPTAISVASSPYTPTNLDSFLAVDTSGGAVTINLQAGAARGGLPLTIKDVTGNAAANPMIVNGNGGETVDGLSPFPMDSNYISVQLIPKAAGGYAVA